MLIIEVFAKYSPAAESEALYEQATLIIRNTGF